MKFLFRLALVTTGATFLLLLAGGTVNPTGSSLACPDWPLCYGSFFPPMTNGVEYEHTHRLIATAVGLLTIGLVLAAWRHRKQAPRVLGLSVAALFVVIVQGVLGGVTVLLRLPIIVSVGHLALSMLFFTFLIYLCFAIRRGSNAPSTQFSATKPWLSVELWPLVGYFAVYLQIILGALVRHTWSGRSCGTEFPLCSGMLWPKTAPQQLHVLHRFAAVALLLIVLGTAVGCLRAAWRFERPLARFAALITPWLMVLQVALGIVTVHSYIAFLPAVAHLGVAALLLAAYAVVFFDFRFAPSAATAGVAISGHRGAGHRPGSQGGR